ncbi:T9SS type A sorting domain-containing protein [Flammeovirga agarivorans]|uniref:T9SS type A sorting domain-containing protein n=1 Tax=Flammeovirga agarivorans TaxID=2726742 RepID=UPI001B3B1DB4|nr:T9SS type A sorting domain-containing protein [Flammeovirga agarivorans]
MFASKDISFSDFQPADAGTYDLYVTSTTHAGQEYNLYQVNLTYTLGDRDSAYIKQVIADLGKTIDNPSDEFRNWTIDGVSYVVNDYGEVTSLDISGNDLTSTPSSLLNLTNLGTLDVSDNQLYFDDLDVLNAMGVASFIYSGQTIDPIQELDETVKGGEGYTSSLTDAPTYSDISYQWVFNESGYSNVLDLDIETMTTEDVGNYQLFISSTNYDGLEIKFADIDIIFSNGNLDSTKVHDLLTELGISFNEDDPFRTWNNDGIITGIDNNGYVTDIDLYGKGLTEVPSTLAAFDNLQNLNLEDNNIYFDELDVLLSYSGDINLTYTGQSVTPSVINEVVKHGDNYNSSITQDYVDVYYDWKKGGSSVYSTKDITFTDFQSADAGTYDLYVTSMTHSGLEFNLYQINLTYTLGDRDSAYLEQVITDLGKTIDNPSDEFRNWTVDGVSYVVNAYGEVTSLDISGNDLTSTPSSLLNLTNLTTLDVSDNQLYFDDLDILSAMSVASFVYDGQSIDPIQELDATVKGGEGYTSSLTDVPTYSDITYQWVFNESGYSNVLDLDIESMTREDEGNYQLFISSSNHDGLEIKYADIDITFALGDRDSTKVHDLLTELGVSFEENDPFRDWLTGGIIDNIDDNGAVGDINLSNLTLTQVPSSLSAFEDLQNLSLDDNNIYFDELDVLLGFSGDINLTYDGQSVTPTVINEVVKHGDNYNSSITQDYADIYYDWKKGGSSVYSTKDLSFTDFQPADAGTYDLYVTSTTHSGLEFNIYQVNLTYTLGDRDSVYLEQVITDLGKTIDNPSDEFRNWTVDGVSYVVNAYGEVTSLDISGNDLTSVPSSILNLMNLETLDVSSNQLYFDDLDYLGTMGVTNFYYGSQSIDPIQELEEIVKGGEGYTSSLTAAPTYSDLTYQWVFSESVHSNVLDLDIESMTREDAGNYQLYISSSNYDGLAIMFADINITFALGDQDSTKVHDLLTELSISFEENDPFRDWNSDGVIVDIDDNGLVLDIDLYEKGLETVPTTLSAFENLQYLSLDNNHLYFDELDKLTGYEGAYVTYENQSIKSTTIINETIKHGDSYNSAIVQNYSDVDYDWRKGEGTLFTSKDISVSDLQPDDAGSYDLYVTSSTHPSQEYYLYQINLNYTLGDRDSVYLENFIADLGKTISNSSDEYRNWIVEGVTFSVDDYGYITALNVSDNNLYEIPSSIENFMNIATLDASNNKLYFDDLDYLNGLGIASLNHSGQTFDTVNTTETVKHSYDFTTSVSQEYGDVYYRWTKDDENIVTETSKDISITDMRLYKAGVYAVYVTSSIHGDQEYKIAEYTINHELGDRDKSNLATLIDALAVSYDNTQDFRDWLGNETTFDSSGYVLGLDLSSLEIESLPNDLTQFIRIESVDLSDNYFFYDDLDILYTVDYEVTYSPQNYVQQEASYEVIQYSALSNDEMAVTDYEGELNYQWYFEDEVYGESGTLLEVENFDSSKEGQYQLKVTSPTSWDGLEIHVANINLQYKSLISEADSLALFELYTEINVDFDPNERIVNWPRMDYEPSTGAIIELNLHELEGLTTLPSIIGQFTSLKTLKLYDNELVSLPQELWSLTSLDYLDLSNNNLGDEDISSLNNLSALRTIWLSGNSFTSIPNISSLNDLLFFIADDNNITEIDNEFTSNTNLLHLSLAGNGIQVIDMDFSGISNLKKIDFSRNEITEWNNSLPTNLEELILYSNLLNDISSIPSNLHIEIADNYLFYNDLEGLDSSYVSYSPQNYDIYYENIALVEGGQYSVSLPIATTSDFSNYIFTWYKDGVIQEQFTSSDLEFTNMSQGDVGIYSCFITHTYWEELSIKVAEIGIGFDCGSELNVEVSPTTETLFCAGDDIVVTIEAGSSDTDVSYSWYLGDELLPLLTSSNITIHETGMYSVRVRNSNGCVAFSDSIQVVQTSPLIAPEIIAVNDSLAIAESDSTLSYYWYLDGEIMEETFTQILPTTFGSYTVEAVNESGCSIFSAEYVINNDQITDLEDELIEKVLPFNVYPQPANEYLFVPIEGIGQVEQVVAFDLTGNRIELSTDILTDKMKVNTSRLNNGVYVITISTTDHEVYHKKILINE